MSGQLTNTLAIGTSPFAITSTTVNTNLNADYLDGQHGSYYLDSANFTGTNWTDLTDGGATILHSHAGSSGSYIIYSDNTDYGTGAVITEVNLASYIMPANTLSTNKGLRITALALSNRTGYETNTYKLYFGATAIATWSNSGVSDDVNAPWAIEVIIFNTATNAQRIMVLYNGNSGWSYTTTAIDTTAAVTIKTTGQTSDAADELTNKMFIVELLQQKKEK